MISSSLDWVIAEMFLLCRNTLFWTAIQGYVGIATGCLQMKAPDCWRIMRILINVFTGIIHRRLSVAANFSSVIWGETQAEIIRSLMAYQSGLQTDCRMASCGIRTSFGPYTDFTWKFNDTEKMPAWHFERWVRLF